MLVTSGNKLSSMDFLVSKMFIFCVLLNLVKAFHFFSDTHHSVSTETNNIGTN